MIDDAVKKKIIFYKSPHISGSINILGF